MVLIQFLAGTAKQSNLNFTEATTMTTTSREPMLVKVPQPCPSCGKEFFATVSAISDESAVACTHCDVSVRTKDLIFARGVKSL
jgi:DNA-directed RNA polymerase subunit RPC12/RpoP